MEEENNSYALEDASRLSRLGAAIIDSLIMMIVTMPLAYYLGVFDDFGVAEPQSSTIAIVGVVGLVFFFLVNGKLLHANAQTVGKKFNNIRVAHLDGSKPSLMQLVLRRYVPYFGFQYIPFVGGVLSTVNLCFIFGKKKRCLHDRIASTRVVKD